MRLPTSPKFLPEVQAETNRQLELADKMNVKKGTDVDLSGGNATRQPRLILVAPNGSRWSVLVSNAGVLSASAI